MRLLLQLLGLMGSWEQAAENVAAAIAQFMKMGGGSSAIAAEAVGVDVHDRQQQIPYDWNYGGL
jgi:hypothetical protein